MSMTFRYKQIERPEPLVPISCPVIPITLKGRKDELGFLALLDSGADTSAMPVGIAKALGLDLKGKKEKIVGIGGSSQGILTNVALKIIHKHERYNFSIRVYAILGEVGNKFPVILGRKDFFDKFKITFIERDKRVVLKRIR